MNSIYVWLGKEKNQWGLLNLKGDTTFKKIGFYSPNSYHLSIAPTEAFIYQ